MIDAPPSFQYVIGGQALFFWVPVHPSAMVVVGMYTGYYLVEDHSGVMSTPPFPWQPSTQMHDDHHKYFHCNFGQHITLLDRWFGTMRIEGENKTYGEDIFAGRSGAGDTKKEMPATTKRLR